MENKGFLFILPADALGGAEYVLLSMAKYLHSHGGRVYVVFLTKEKTGGWRNQGLPDENLFFSPKAREAYGVLFMARTVITLSRKHDLQYFFSSHLHLNALIGLLKGMRLIKGKAIARESTLIFDRFRGIKLQVFRSLYYLGYPFLDILICQTDLMEERLKANLPQWLLHTKVIPNPVNLDEIVTQGRREIEGDRPEKYLVAAGRLIPLKGFDLLLKAFAEIDDPDLSLVILGKGPEKASLEKQARELQVTDRFHLPGFIDNPMPWFKRAHIGVVSSLVEGFPNVLLQMMALNNSVVSTTCADGIENLAGVVTCKPGSAAELKSAIKELLDNPRPENRIKFDEELDRRSIEAFIQRVFEEVETQVK